MFGTLFLTIKIFNDIVIDNYVILFKVTILTSVSIKEFSIITPFQKHWKMKISHSLENSFVKLQQYNFFEYISPNQSYFVNQIG